MADGCIFCKIAGKEIQTEIVHEDDDVLAFRDINPQAPVHILFIPKEHIETLNDVSELHSGLISKLVLAAKETARAEGISEDGYRLVMNCNKAAGQEVFHLHLHLLGGRKFSWPPG